MIRYTLRYGASIGLSLVLSGVGYLLLHPTNPLAGLYLGLLCGVTGGTIVYLTTPLPV